MDKTITFELDMTDNEHVTFYCDLKDFRGVSKVELGIGDDFRENFEEGDEFPRSRFGMGGDLTYRITATEDVISLFNEKLKEGYYNIVYYVADTVWGYKDDEKIIN